MWKFNKSNYSLKNINVENNFLKTILRAWLKLKHCRIKGEVK